MLPTDLTVAAIVEKDGQYLVVDEYAMGNRVLNQPGGHIETGESPETAVVREVLEETGCHVVCRELVGVYLWIHPQTRQQFLRLVYVADFLSCDTALKLDASIIERRWMSRADLESRRERLRTPAVLRCIHDFEAGRRHADSLFANHLPLHHNVDVVLASADLV